MPALDSITMKHGLVNDMQTRMWKDMTESYWRSASGLRTAEEQLHFGQVSSNALVATYPSADAYRQFLSRVVQFSDNYYISPEMCVLVTAAAESMPEDEQPKPDDFPTPGGWLLIPNGLVQTDIRGAAVITNVIVWNTSGGKIRLTYLTDKFHPLDRMNTYAGLLKAAEEENAPDPNAWARRTWDGMPRLTVWHDMDADFHHSMPRSVSMGAVIPPEISNQISVRDLPDGSRAISFPKGYRPDELPGFVEGMAPTVQTEPVFRWLLACLRLMQQELTTVTDQGLPANLRRSLKGKVRLKNTHVSVIEYRRRSTSMPGEGTREYTHRFLRRGHWRWQPYKTEEHEWDRKRIWIHPTIVGDPSLPLLLREHVKAFVR
jgi:hypothetical protein